MVYTVNPFIPTTWKVLPSRIPESKQYYRHWVEVSDYFIHITTEQREAPDQYIGNRPPTAMLGLLEAKALRHLLDGFIARAEAKRAEKPRDEFSDVYNLPEGHTMDEAIRFATNRHLDAIHRDHPNPYLGQQAAKDEMAKRRQHDREIATYEQKLRRQDRASTTQLVDE